MKMHARACRLLGVVLAFGLSAYGEPNRELVGLQTTARLSIVRTIKAVKSDYGEFHADVERAGKAVEDAVREIRRALPDGMAMRGDKLWADFCLCRAADAKFHERARALTGRIEEVETLTALDQATVERLVALANELVEEYNKIKGEKWLLDARMKVRGIEARARTYREDAVKKIKLAVERRAREEAEKRAAETAAEKRKELVGEEQAKAQEAFDGLARDLRRIDWVRCTRQLARVKDGMTTHEGKVAVESQLKKIAFMEGMQRHFVKHAKGFRFKGKRGNLLVTVVEADDRSLTLRKMTYEGGTCLPDAKTTRVSWEDFYALKDQERKYGDFRGQFLGYMNQFIQELVVRGRETTKISARARSEYMLGAALTLRHLYGDKPGVDKFVPELVKRAVKDFEPYRTWAVKWFPDVELEDPVE